VRALVVTHDPDEGPGWLAEWLPAAGLDLEVLAPYAGDELPAALDGYDALVVMGGPQQAYDDGSAAWLRGTKALLRGAVAAGTPVLAVCLGAQLLAEATGGVVEPGGSGPELGARLVAKRDVAGADPLVWDTPMSWICVQWHWDAVTELPPGATLLASSTRYPHQMFRVGERAWGLQFHVETPEAMVRAWVDQEADALREAGGDPEALLDRTLAELPEVAALWRPVAERFAAVVRGEDPRPRALPLV
jgi:GMP synthase-like glutamine amidotransferase